MSITVNDTPSATFQPPSSAKAQGSSALDKDQFLKLLVAQLKNQDPTQPQDPTAFIAQLAQFSSLEAQQNTNTKLDSLILAEATTSQANASSLIGKQVAFKTSDVTLVTGKSTTSGGHLAADAANVTVAVKDASGKLVRTLQLGKQTAGELLVVWDGTSDLGGSAPAGKYTLQAAAFDANQKAVGIDLTDSGVVSGVAFNGATPQLTVNNHSINMSDVTSIQERNTTP